MKRLSLKQPYAELLISGKKTNELRTWNTKFRGEFLVHASKKINKEICQSKRIDPSTLVTGAIIGKTTLYDVKYYNDKEKFDKDKNKHLAGIKYQGPKYGFLVKDAKRFKKPIFMPGKLGFFNVNIKD